MGEAWEAGVMNRLIHRWIDIAEIAGLINLRYGIQTKSAPGRCLYVWMYGYGYGYVDM